MVHASRKPARKLSLVHQPTLDAKTVRIAFATHDNKSVNQHFGSATQFSIYYICPKSWTLVELIEFAKSPPGHDVNKLKQRVDALSECSAIYCNAIGVSAIKQLLVLNIKPINVDAGTEIKTLLHKLTTQWQANPNYWLANIIRHDSKKTKVAKLADESAAQPSEKRLASLLDEEWEL
ncbi:MAG: NifB/NifX family molybdenum-iron cluster-binding protein [Colwellia sp.]